MNNCNCCCTNTLNLCRQNVCVGLDLGIQAQVPGVHQLRLFFLGININVEAEFAFGQQMIFPIDELNELFEYTGEVYDPVGAKILIRKDGVDYDCFRFRSAITVTKSNVSIS